jgi:hypothetical protein
MRTTYNNLHCHVRVCNVVLGIFGLMVSAGCDENDDAIEYLKLPEARTKEKRILG